MPRRQGASEDLRTAQTRHARRIRQARGEMPADLVIKNARILDVVTGTLEPGDIAIAGDTIFGVYDAYAGDAEIEAGGLIAVPGFVDTHVHIENTMVTPAEFDRAALSRGTTTAICDPRGAANVLGVPATTYFLDCAGALALDLRAQLPSCVPATELETSEARLAAVDRLSFRDHPAVLGLTEMMNFPGLLRRDKGVLAKLSAFAGRIVDGHAPSLRGRGLNA